MAKSVGSDAKSNSRLCFTFVKVTTPTAPRTPLPTKFAVAEKHTAIFSFVRLRSHQPFKVTRSDAPAKIVHPRSTKPKDIGRLTLLRRRESLARSIRKFPPARVAARRLPGLFLAQGRHGVGTGGAR